MPNEVSDATELDLHNDEVFLKVYWPAFLTAQAIVDMPDQLLSIFVRSCMKNGGALPQAERDRFSKLTDYEVARMEAGVLEAMNTVRERKPAPR